MLLVQFGKHYGTLHEHEEIDSKMVKKVNEKLLKAKESP